MPTILRIGPHRFFFYSNEGNEPMHIHVESGNATAKFWLDPKVELGMSKGYNSKDLSFLIRVVREHEGLFKEKWNEFFSRG